MTGRQPSYQTSPLDTRCSQPSGLHKRRGRQPSLLIADVGVLATSVDEGLPAGVAEHAGPHRHLKAGSSPFVNLTISGVPPNSLPSRESSQAMQNLALSSSPSGGEALPLCVDRTPRPYYAGLDSQGYEHVRPARTVAELRTYELRCDALCRATQTLAERLGCSAVHDVAFGVPVHRAFGMSKRQAKAHTYAELLLSLGCHLELRWCGFSND